MKTAVRPNFFLNIPVLEKLNKKGLAATEEEQALYTMANTAGWKIFRAYAEETSRQLNGLNAEAIAQGMPLEEIGRNAIVVSLAQGVIDKLLNKVSDAGEACESGE